MYQSILQVFPGGSRNLFKYTAERENHINEIRLRCEKPILIMEGGKEWFIDKNGFYTNQLSEAMIMEREELERIIQHICHYSLYAYEEELRQGYITVAGGHRIGLVGQVVMESDGQIRTMKYIRGLNIRVSHQLKGVAQPILPFLYDLEGNVKSTLIVSPPGCGKTTLLRDLVRYVSDGNVYSQGQTVGVVDERSEIAGSFLGQPQNDVGIRTDILDACPKAVGMMLLLRAMSPRVIAIDELGSEKEIEAVQTVANCGSKMLATMHGNCLEDIYKRNGMRVLMEQGCFEMVLVLGRLCGKCVIRKIYERKKDGEWQCKDGLDSV